MKYLETDVILRATKHKNSKATVLENQAVLISLNMVSKSMVILGVEQAVVSRHDTPWSLPKGDQVQLLQTKNSN